MDRKVEIRSDHIGVFKNFFTNDLIESYIRVYNDLKNVNEVWRRPDQAHIKNDEGTSLISSSFINKDLSLKVKYTNKPFIDIFFNELYPYYTERYSILNTINVHSIYDMKVQKTLPGEGYHSWHFENMGKGFTDRILAFSLYLNDVEEGGETEFLYQKCRFKPEKNTLLLWPASYTHVHRGNQPLSGEKYILTGWIEYGV